MDSQNPPQPSTPRPRRRQTAESTARENTPARNADAVEGVFRDPDAPKGGEMVVHRAAPMMMSVPPTAKMPTMAELAYMDRYAVAVFRSRLFQMPNADAAVVLMLKGYELGLSPMAAFEFVHLINGRPSLSPRGALALVRQSGLLDDGYPKVERGVDGKVVTVGGLIDNNWVEVTMKRRGGDEYSARFSMQQAQEAGLVKEKGPWLGGFQPNMLLWRSSGFCMDWLFSDVTGGLKRADEFGAALDASGEVIPDSWQWINDPVPDSTPVVRVPTEAEQVSMMLSDIVAKYGAPAMLKAGGVPQTIEQAREMMVRLEAASQEKVNSDGSTGTSDGGDTRQDGAPATEPAPSGPAS